MAAAHYTYVYAVHCEKNTSELAVIQIVRLILVSLEFLFW